MTFFSHLEHGEHKHDHTRLSPQGQLLHLPDRHRLVDEHLQVLHQPLRLLPNEAGTPIFHNFIFSMLKLNLMIFCFLFCRFSFLFKFIKIY